MQDRVNQRSTVMKFQFSKQWSQNSRKNKLMYGVVQLLFCNDQLSVLSTLVRSSRLFS